MLLTNMQIGKLKAAQQNKKNVYLNFSVTQLKQQKGLGHRFKRENSHFIPNTLTNQMKQLQINDTHHKLFPLNNQMLTERLSHISFFRDVYSKNNLPKRICANECGIINNESIPGPRRGTHWVCYWNDVLSTTVEFFDPFGLFPAVEIRKYLQTSKKPLEYNTSQFQDINSVTCGHFCIYFPLERYKGRKYLDILTDFTLQPRKKNDSLLKRYLFQRTH